VNALSINENNQHSDLHKMREQIGSNEQSSGGG